MNHYNTTAIQSLLLDAFNQEGIRSLCQKHVDMQPVLNQFAENPTLKSMTDTLIEYCEKQALLPELLLEIRLSNPRQYDRYKDQLLGVSDLSVNLYEPDLPPPDFTGREQEILDLKAAILEDRKGIVGLFGMPGVGKTALALRLAEELSPYYPDGRVSLDLQGISKQPLSPYQAMAHVIRVCDPSIRLPESQTDLQRTYRSVLSDKQVLLLMDDAKDKAQIGPLRPPTSCLLLLTSRQRFYVPGIHAQTMAPLSPHNAHALLLRIEPRIGRHADALASLCGYLPQALRIAGSHLCEHIDLHPADYLRQLQNAQIRLELVDATLEISYDFLDDEMKRLWCMLSVFPSFFDSSAAELVWNLDSVPTQTTLSELVRYGLVQWNERVARYYLHDLVRLFASQKIAKSDTGLLELNIIKALQDPRHRHRWAITAGQCLLRMESLEWPSKRLRPVVIEAIRESMQEHRMPQNASPNQVLTYLNLVGRYTGSPADRVYLVQSITPMLVSELSDRQKTQLLIYRGGLQGQLRQLEGAESDYREATRLANRLLGSEDSLPGDCNLMAHATLGIANLVVIRAEESSESEERDELLKTAITLYEEAIQAAKDGEPDDILESNIYTQLGWTYALLEAWEDAERSYGVAQDALKKKLEHKALNTYLNQYAWVLETVSYVHWKRGNSLISKQEHAQALVEYETAYALTQEEIEILQRTGEESRRLVMAYINSGDYSMARGECPGESYPEQMAKACADWQRALAMARRLGISDMEQVATNQLSRHCQESA